MFNNTDGAISNANNAPFGVCTVNNSTLNVPFYGGVLTTRVMLTIGFGTLVVQVVFSGTGSMLVRRKTSSGWQDWYEFTGANVS